MTLEKLQDLTATYVSKCSLILQCMGICLDLPMILGHFQTVINTLRSRLNGRHFADDIFKWIFLIENAWISIIISLKFVLKGPINNIQALVQLWLGADQATNHYLNQWWLNHWRIYESLGLNELIISHMLPAEKEIISFVCTESLDLHTWECASTITHGNQTGILGSLWVLLFAFTMRWHWRPVWQIPAYAHSSK